MVVYLDGVMGLNFLVDWLLLLGVNRMSGFPPGKGRTAAAAAVGGGYAGACMLPGFSFLGNGLWRAVSLGIMSVTAFGLSRSAMSRGMLFVLLSMALGGLAMSFHSGDSLSLILCAAALALLCHLGFRGKVPGRELLPVKVCFGNREVEFLALRDTGNTLRDPVTGEAVLVADAEIGMQLLGLPREMFLNPVEAMGKIPGLRLIPCRTVGSGGFLLAVRCDQVTVDGKAAGKLVAFSGEAFGSGEYRGLTGGQFG